MGINGYAIWILLCYSAFVRGEGLKEDLDKLRKKVVDHVPDVVLPLGSPKKIEKAYKAVEKMAAKTLPYSMKSLALISQLAKKSTEGKGVGTSLGIGVGESLQTFVEAVRFGDRTRFYCGGQSGMDPNMGVSQKVYDIESEGCGKKSYLDGQLTLSANVSLTGIPIKLNVGKDLLIGLNNDAFEKAMSGINDARKEITKISAERATVLFSKLMKKIKGHDVTPSQAIIAMMLLKDVYRVQDVVGKGLSDFFIRTDEGRSLMKEINNGGLLKAPDMKALTKDLGRAFSDVSADIDDKETKKFGGLISNAFDRLSSVMSGCQSTQTGVGFGAGTLPISGGVSYTKRSPIGSVSDKLAATFVKNPINLASMTGASFEVMNTIEALTEAKDPETKELMSNIEKMSVLGNGVSSAISFVTDVCVESSREDYCKVKRGLGLDTITGYFSILCNKQ